MPYIGRTSILQNKLKAAGEDFDGVNALYRAHFNSTGKIYGGNFQGCVSMPYIGRTSILRHWHT